MKKATLPTLSSNGWLTDETLMMGTLFNYFKTSKYNQSTTYFGNISSLPFLIKKYADDLDTLSSQIETSLVNLYGRYYSSSDVIVVISELSADNKTVLKIDMEVTTTNVSGKMFKLSEAVTDDIIMEDSDISPYYE